ncbi:MAG TPA: methyltransferase domain-containing protein, partial [Micavibrio sp.]
IGTLIASDLSQRRLRQVSGLKIHADEEFLPFAAGSLDLVLSPLALHSVNDLPGTLLQIRQALKPDGLFMAALLGGETLHELRQAAAEAEMNLRGGLSPRIFPFADKPQMGSLLQRAGFSLPVVDSEIVTVTYEDAFKLMRDIRMMGEGNAIIKRDRSYAGKALFMETARLYQERFSGPGGCIEATFEVIFLIGWSPHESQQKPLKPGSATSRLADILCTDEINVPQ